MQNEDGSIVVVFNGEFYNCNDYRSELNKKGHIFHSKSDTEVIVHLYEEYGISGILERMNGMFAFALLDRSKKMLYLARDRVGIKPLFYSSNENMFSFGSELKVFLGNDGFKAEFDKRGIASLFRYGYVPAPHTVLNGVSKVPPGHFLEYSIKSNKKKLRKYWNPSFSASNRSESDIIDELDFLLEDSVRLRLISDVPVGTFLSGGIDSTLVTAYAQYLKKNVATFSIGFENEAYNELKWARYAAKKLKTDHHEKSLKLRAVDSLPSIIDLLDEPNFDSSILPTHILSEMTREKVKVALSGDGGDECFIGYTRYFKLAKEVHLNNKIKGVVPPGLLRLMGNMYPFKMKGAGTIRRMSANAGDCYRDILNFSSVSTVMEKMFDHNEEYEPYPWFDFSFNEDLYYSARRTDFFNYLPEDCLTKVDRGSMAVGLEVRTPLLDHRICEFGMSVPSATHLGWGRGKTLLMKLLQKRFGFGEEFLFREKMGFGIPLRQWVGEPALDLFNNPDEHVRIRKFINPDIIDYAIDNLDKKIYRDTSSILWGFVILEKWCRKWNM